MFKRRRQIIAWWESLDTDADNLRVNPNIFKAVSEGEKYKDYGDKPDKINPENCYIIREALQKLYQFLNASHNDGCSDKGCRYDPKTCSLKIRIKKKKTFERGLDGEFKLRKKRGRKSKFELQQMALMKAANGAHTL